MNSIYTWIPLIVAVLTLVAWITGIFRWIARKFPYRIINKLKHEVQIPSSTIRVVDKNMRACYWERKEVEANDKIKVTTMLRGEFWVTNITNTTLYLGTARLKKGGHKGRLLIYDTIETGYEKFIPGNTTTTVIVIFEINKILKDNKKYISDVVIIDQYGNENEIGKRVFTQK